MSAAGSRRRQIVPPTSQNQAAIEADMTSFAPTILHVPHDVATLRLEQLIRSYDPCISCATHFLDLTRGDRAMSSPGPHVRSSGVLVCGNAERGDDGVAPAAIAALLPTLPSARPVEARGPAAVRSCGSRTSSTCPPTRRVSSSMRSSGSSRARSCGCRSANCSSARRSRRARRISCRSTSSSGWPPSCATDRSTGTFVGLAGRGFGYGAPLSLAARPRMPAYCTAIGAELDRLAVREPALASRSVREA